MRELQIRQRTVNLSRVLINRSVLHQRECVADQD